MGLDTSFYAVKKTEVGYFRKYNFLLNYFNVDTETDDCKDIEISKEQLAELIVELKCELAQHKCGEIGEPINKKFCTTECYYGGSTAYDEVYWESLDHVYHWANVILNSFDWDENILVMNNWW